MGILPENRKNVVKRMMGGQWWKKKRRGQGKDCHLDGESVPTAASNKATMDSFIKKKLAVLSGDSTGELP
jgi:hypothetical protein